MRPIKEYLFQPDPDIGGAIIPLVGMPGAGKTVALTQIGKRAFESNHVVLWRGTKQGQWANLLANDIPVTLWNHDSLENFEAIITGENPGDKPRYMDLDNKDVQIETWNSARELVGRLDSQRVNIVNIPGLQGDMGQSDHHLYFFRHMWLNIVDALIDRDWLRFVTFIGDEWGDIMPCQQQLRKPFYKLVAERFPPKLSQLRKQNCFLYGAAHSTHDVHYFFWKIKSNSIIYMTGANVKSDLTPEVKQEVVSRLDRGEFVMPPKDKDHFTLPKVAEDLEWIPESNKKKFRLKWNSNAPDWLGENKKDVEVENIDQIPKSFVNDIERDVKIQWVKYLHKELDMSYQEITEVEGLPDSKSTISGYVDA